MTLALMFLTAELVDLVTFLQMPMLEDNPVIAGTWTPAVVLAKVAGPMVVAGLAVVGLSGWRREFMLAFAIGFATFCAGANVATLNIYRTLVG